MHSDHERRLRADLVEAISAVNHRTAVDVEAVSEYLLEEDQINRYLVGLQDECTRASFYCTATRSIVYKSITEEPPSTLAGTVPDVANRRRLRDWIVDQEWSWIHPRYRWLLDG
ncbi:hypothetical protein [Natrarchaeobius oligotrophus]|uniref:Uncharacterized protein n=1 Tax=Natrarchaeobius chitinivorans TaxID=1679083 RepID=A0A3N6N0F6_NATCH|nr:hypothetical protein [Natrarchaeobius chitinivorans]RQH02292.1 hypothetical protein EA472_03050 [Natrarchaeobius chitinivorans]